MQLKFISFSSVFLLGCALCLPIWILSTCFLFWPSPLKIFYFRKIWFFCHLSSLKFSLSLSPPPLRLLLQFDSPLWHSPGQELRPLSFIQCHSESWCSAPSILRGNWFLTGPNHFTDEPGRPAGSLTSCRIFFNSERKKAVPFTWFKSLEIWNNCTHPLSTGRNVESLASGHLIPKHLS